MTASVALNRPPLQALLALLLALGIWPATGINSRAAGQPTPSQATARVGLDQVQSGALLVKTGQGYVEALQLGTDVKLTVSGPTVRGVVTQAFTNPTRQWVEAVYAYPMAEDGSVDSLKMIIGNRIVIGEIRERAAARAAFETAKAQGVRASLVEQERPNLFTNSVANIGPGETVIVQIEYQEPVRRADGAYSVRVPLVAGPRYNPGLRDDDSDPVPDRARLASPVVDPRVSGPANPVTISVRLQAGFALGAVTSAHHAVQIQRESAQVQTVVLAQALVPADRDFELSWRPAAANTPLAGLFREQVGGADYVLAYVTPPTQTQRARRAPRETVFVIDNSGSMSGESMRQAKQSLLYGLSRLSREDRFNIVRFDNTFEVLFPDAVAADAEHVGRASRFVQALDANGGTEMLPAMRAALRDLNPSETQRVRQVVFLTDGAIGNEQGLLDEIAAHRGRSRIFMVGIGSAPNSYLMSRAAELGRGVFTHIGSTAEVEERMRLLFSKLENPVATDLKAEFTGVGADVTPALLPDLYRDEPVMLAARLDGRRGSVKVSGMVDGRPWSVELPIASAASGQGISKVWAGRKVADAEVAMTLGKIGWEEADARILALGLDHHLVTRRTSLVAIDRTPSRPAGQPLSRSELPINLPAGWDFDKLFPDPGAFDGATRPDAKQIAQSIDLPQGATDAELRLIFGLVLSGLGLSLLAAGRSRRQAA